MSEKPSLGAKEAQVRALREARASRSKAVSPKGFMEIRREMLEAK